MARIMETAQAHYTRSPGKPSYTNTTQCIPQSCKRNCFVGEVILPTKRLLRCHDIGGHARLSRGYPEKQSRH